ncbi:MAG: ABC transporter ATP-binding protein [Myxococcaceae bacterium]|nr:ABC transporter ATP-binding protein [Myxococcaceae bacterium]MCA3014605.1 ABC transporter ATP-binding protein [Myxococcaceae bacterium]
MSQTAIRLDRLSKHFGPKRAVDDVSFEVQAGHCYGLIGPNGAGKTTTFSMMTGYLFPTSGTISILGVDPFEPGALKGKVGVLPQDAILPPTWPVGALLTYYGELSGLPSPEAEARRVLEKVQLPETWGLYSNQLSHGMAKRVSMAQALMGSPPVIFLDEPTAGLDPKIAASVRQVIRELKGQHTVVVSSHNLQELEELCDATAILDKGKLVSAATMSELTGQMAEFRVQLARGEVPTFEVKALSGVKDARIEPNNVLCVSFDGKTIQPEEIITRTCGLLVERKVLFTGVWRGKKLEEKVLQLT